MTKSLWCVPFLLCCVTGQAGEVFPDGQSPEKLWNEGTFTEGVASSKDGTIYFSDISQGDKPGRVLKFDPATRQTSVYCPDSGQSNGLMFDSAGRLLAACGANHGRRGLAEILTDGTVKDLVSHIDGKHFNAPNDLVIHQSGKIYFSDPRYVGDEPIELDLMWVFMYDPVSNKTLRATSEVTKPNGVIVSPDGKTLYVAETNNGSPAFGKQAADPRMSLNAFAIKDDGTLGAKKVLAEFDPAGGIDGMTVDSRGRIYGAFRNPQRFGIIVFNPEGKEIDFLPTPELPTNCCFGRGDEAGILYMTVGTGLYRIATKATGHHSVP